MYKGYNIFKAVDCLNPDGELGKEFVRIITNDLYTTCACASLEDSSWTFTDNMGGLKHLICFTRTCNKLLIERFFERVFLGRFLGPVNLHRQWLKFFYFKRATDERR